MARLIQLLLIVTLTAAVWSAPHRYDSDSSSSSSSSEELHRVARSPHHDGTDHDHADEKTDQDHEHPVLTGDSLKTLGGSASTQSRPARDTPESHKHQESEDSSQEKDDETSRQGKDQDECKEKGISIACRGHVTKDSETKLGENQQPNNLSLYLADAPGPLLLQGRPILSGIRDSASHEEKSSQEQSKTKTKRNSPPGPGYPKPPSTDKNNPHLGPHLDPTPPPGYKPKYNNKRDTSAAEKVSPLSSIDGPLKKPESTHFKTEDGREGVIEHEPRPGLPQAQHKRDTSDTQLGGPFTTQQTIHGQTQDDKTPAHVPPPGPQPKQKRETTPDTHSSGPHEKTQVITGKTDDGRVAAQVLPPRPGGPGGPKQKRDTADHTQIQPQIQPVRPVPANPKPQTLPAIHPAPHPQHKREAEKNEENKNEKPATLNKEVKNDEDEKKEEHKQKRDTYKLDPKDSGHESPLHTQPQSGEEKLSPPTHESEYDRHARATEKEEEKDSLKTSETHPAESDDKKSESSEKKKDA